jgi:hypothetical protein
MKRRVLGNALAGLALTLAGANCTAWGDLTGSGSTHNTGDSTERSSSPEDGTGAVSVQLDLAPGTTLTSVKWTISNGTNSYSGVVDMGDAQSLEFAQGGIVAGAVYTVQLTATDSNGDLCTGTSPSFAVTSGAVTQTTLLFTCTVAADGSVASSVTTGTLEVDASVNLVTASPVPCPGISSFSISPSGINLSQTAALNLVTLGPPSQITWAVSPATGGTIGSLHAAATTFACSAGAAFVPQVTITATVTLLGSNTCDGQRFTSMSALVDCLGP